MAQEVHIFKGYDKAREWADKKNTRARKYKWVVKARSSGGYGVYKTKR